MVDDPIYMQRALQLARQGYGRVAPNPTVGAVIVRNGEIIGEGFHAQYGREHAEVLAIRSVKKPELLTESTIYVTLEPCSHWGKTPPCAALIIEKKIPRVVVGTLDPFHRVSGNGVKMMREAGVEVVVGCIEQECLDAAKEFFCFVEKRRPYIILKWAQTADGYIDRIRTVDHPNAAQISTEQGRVAVHKLRAETAAIMIGTQTAIKDNPSLTTRYFYGKNPIRIILDRYLRIPLTHQLFDRTAPTIIYTEQDCPNQGHIQYRKTTFDDQLLPNILSDLHKQGVQSLLVEGGAQLHQSFIDSGLYDEIHIETSHKCFGEGIQAAKLPTPLPKLTIR